MNFCKKHNWETQLIAPHKLGTVCTNCGILKKDFDMKTEENMTRKDLIKLATIYKQDTNNKDFESIPQLMADFHLMMVAPQKPTEQKPTDKEYHLNPMSAKEYAEMYLGTKPENDINYLAHLFEEYGRQFQGPVDDTKTAKEILNRYAIDTRPHPLHFRQGNNELNTDFIVLYDDAIKGMIEYRKEK